MTHMCEICGKVFSGTNSLGRHRRQVHGGEWHTCNQCQISYTQFDKLKAHLKKCQTEWSCTICGQHFSSLLHFNRHRVTHHPETVPKSMATKKRKGKSIGYTCNTCFNTFICVQFCECFFIFLTAAHAETAGPRKRISSQCEEPDNGMPADPPQPEESMLPDNPELREVFTQHWAALRTHHITDRRVQDRYNYRWVPSQSCSTFRTSCSTFLHFRLFNTFFLFYRVITLDMRQWDNQLETEIFETQSSRFKINLSYGFVLWHNESVVCAVPSNRLVRGCIFKIIL